MWLDDPCKHNVEPREASGAWVHACALKSLLRIRFQADSATDSFPHKLESPADRPVSQDFQASEIRGHANAGSKGVKVNVEIP